MYVRPGGRKGEFKAMYDIGIVKKWSVRVLVISSNMCLQVRFFDEAQYGHVELRTKRRIFKNIVSIKSEWLGIFSSDIANFLYPFLF